MTDNRIRARRARRRRSLAGLALALAAAAATVSPAAEQPTGPPRGAAAALLGEERRLEPAVARVVEEAAAEVARAPASAAAHGRLGLVCEANNLWPEARASFARAAELDPADALWRLHQAIAAREAGDPEAALAGLRAVVEQQPGLAAARQRLGLALLERGDLAGARAQFETLSRLARGAPEGLAGLAQIDLLEGAAAEAAALLERALRRDPGHMESHYLLGLAYRQLGRHEEARRRLALGRDSRPRYLPDPLTPLVEESAVHLSARLERAGGLLAGGRPDLAAALLEEARADHPDDVQLLNDLALAYLRQGRTDAALETLETARGLEPARFSTYLNLSACWMRLGRLEQALAAAARAVELAPELGRTHLARAGVLAALGRYPEAHADGLRSAELDPGNPRTYLILGELELRLDRPRQAIDRFAVAAELTPGRPDPHLGMARAHLRLGDTGAARAALTAAAAAAPGDPRVRSLLSRLPEGDDG